MNGSLRVKMFEWIQNMPLEKFNYHVSLTRHPEYFVHIFLLFCFVLKEELNSSDTLNSFQYLIGQLKNLRSNSKDYISREYSATNIEVTLSKQKEYCMHKNWIPNIVRGKKRKTIEEKTWFRVRPEFSVVILWS